MCSSDLTKNYFAQFSTLADTSYSSGGLNTSSMQYVYKVEFYCNGILKGSTQKASSVFLSAQGFDNKILLNWNATTPWSNYKYHVFRESAPGSANWILIDSTTQTNYTDAGLINGQTYCYKIKSVGQYSDPDIFHPLINFSQEVCAIPMDTEPPCQPTMNAQGNCNSVLATLNWTNPNGNCADDVLYYKIYYKNQLNGQFVLLDSITLVTDTIYIFDGNTSIAGCFADRKSTRLNSSH